MKKWIVLTAVALTAAVAPRDANAGCPPGTSQKYECMQWQNDCAPTWIHTCWCCISDS